MLPFSLIDLSHFVRQFKKDEISKMNPRMGTTHYLVLIFPEKAVPKK
jgi:hypothetical protein